MLVLLVLFWALLPLPKSSKTFSYPCRACCRVADGTTTKTVAEKTDSFASWQEATSCSLAGVSMKRLSKLYLLVRGGCPLGVRGDWPEPVL